MQRLNNELIEVLVTYLAFCAGGFDCLLADGLEDFFVEDIPEKKLLSRSRMSTPSRARLGVSVQPTIDQFECRPNLTMFKHVVHQALHKWIMIDCLYIADDAQVSTCTRDGNIDTARVREKSHFA